MAEDKEQRTERATPKRRSEAREKGDVAKSREVTSVAVLMAAVGTLYFSKSHMVENLMEITGRSFLEAGAFEFTPERLHLLLVDLVVKVGLITFPVFLGVFFLGIVSNIAQVGFLFTTEPLAPKIEKIDPVKGLQRIFSLRSVAELIKSILKIIIISAVVYSALKGEMENVPPLMFMSTAEIAAFIGGVSFRILLKSSWVLLILAILDYAYQKWEYEKKLRMTKQEVKDEMKQSEGDPQVKSRIRSLQREWARQRMMEEVPRADVVITNPTHFAVALRYKKEEAAAPIVVAKGRNLVAEKIKKVAKEAGVPVVEDKPLARTLFKAIDIGEEIPAKVYRAVAEVLAYVYRVKGRSL